MKKRCRCAALVDAPGKPLPEKLDALNQYDKQYDGGDHDVGLKAVVAVTNGKVTDASTAHHAGHGRVRQEADSQHGGCQDQPGTRLDQQHLGNDLQWGGAHRFGGLDNATWDVAQGLFDQPGEIEDCRQ